MSTAITSAFVVFLKDFRSEIRTRYALNALLMFVVTTISIILFALGNETASTDMLSGILWVIIFFSSMAGLSRTFVSEEERGTVMTLQLIATPIAIFVGKFLFNLVLLVILNFISIVLYSMVINNFVIKSYAIFLPTIVLGTIGLATTSTIMAALISKAGSKATLYPVLSFPILLPLLISLINETKLAVNDAPFVDAIPDFQVLVAYCIVIVTASYILFEFIWKE